MARYDYGLRGPRDTTPPRTPRAPSSRYDRDFPEMRSGPRPNRVTARYNMDYVRARGPIYPRNPHPYGGDQADRIGGEEAYRRSYNTVGGTRTHRGTPHPRRYDYLDYGPDFGGRYPDEL